MKRSKLHLCCHSREVSRERIEDEVRGLRTPNSDCGPLELGLLGAGPHLGVGVASTLVGCSGAGPRPGR